MLKGLNYVRPCHEAYHAEAVERHDGEAPLGDGVVDRRDRDARRTESVRYDHERLPALRVTNSNLLPLPTYINIYNFILKIETVLLVTPTELKKNPSEIINCLEQVEKSHLADSDHQKVLVAWIQISNKLKCRLNHQ
jgi:hypothetical protein